VTRHPDPERIYTPPVDETAGLSLFNQAPTPVRPAPVVQMQGGRETALERLAPHLSGLRGRVYVGIQEHGPITRDRLAEKLGIKENTVNGRCAELLKASLIRISGYDRTSGRAMLEAVEPPAEG
jgi:predicted HTH transcriptional regulator